MARALYRHIFLGDDWHGRMDYTRPPGGGGAHVPRRPNPQQHGEYLRRRLDEAWRQAREASEERRAQAVALPTRTGTYIEFRSDAGAELASKSLEDRRRNIRLLSVGEQPVAGEEEPETFATVFVPETKEGHFLRKIQQYAQERTAKGEPRNRPLIDSIADIRKAVIESFWQDAMPLPTEEATWCEAWLRVESEQHENVEHEFRGVLQQLDIQVTEGALRFPERSVVRILANTEQLAELIEASDHVAEFRRAKETAGFWIDLPNAEQTEWVQNLLNRLDVQDDTAVAVCLLDTGVNSGHPLLQPVLGAQDCHSVDPRWGADDHDKHGTLMAGVAAFGDLRDALATHTPVVLHHRLESAKIVPRRGQNPPGLYGYVTAQGISRAEIQAPDRLRVICLAMSSTDDRDLGRPSSWSAELDALTSGYADGTRRLMVVSAGNIRASSEWSNYPDSNLTNAIHDPGQAWNALTVGAFTQKTQIDSPVYHGYSPVAPPDSLSPFSTTSLLWERRKWPAKPDILLEGGNAARDGSGQCTDVEDLSLLSTHYQPVSRHFSHHNATSAAAALAARMAARLQADYPDAWPETVRALLVHSAEWTLEMRRMFLRDQSKSSYAELLSICGYGVPTYERARQCAANTLTLVSEKEIQPYGRAPDGRYVTRDMHLYELPWPRDVLLGMGEAAVTMRVTLSYFVEPGPGQIGWLDRYRYPSHALRFDVNSPGESRNDFIIRLNHAARQEGETPETGAASDRWTIGSTSRNRGSIHSDIWRGTAAEIAGCNLIGVYPLVGWWRERHHLGRWNRVTRYSLVVSIQTPQEDVDIYTPVATEVGIALPVEIEVENGET